MTDYAALSNEELSSEIARRLFNEGPGCDCDLGPTSNWAKPYARDHNVAMGLVVPEMRRLGWHLSMDEKNGQLLVSFWAWDNRPEADVLSTFGQEPRAICEAALKALEA